MYIYCTMYSVYFALYPVACILCPVYCILCTVYCILHSVYIYISTYTYLWKSDGVTETELHKDIEEEEKIPSGHISSHHAWPAHGPSRCPSLATSATNKL